jgi:hypothetical protein
VARTRPESPAHPWARPAEIVIRRGDFDFAQLNDWHSRLRNVFTISGIEFLDTDEARNRVVVGVHDDATKARVQRMAEDLAVPKEALIVEIVPPGHLVTTLQDYVRPVDGGMQVEPYFGGISHQCTVGINVLYTNLSHGIQQGTPGFYTASHCSEHQANGDQPDTTVFYQGGVRIGQEAWDPPFFTGSPCPGDRECRWSDVTFVAYDAGVSRHQGYLAQTNYRGFGLGQPGSLDINPTTPEFVAQYAPQTPVVGMYLDKVGRTTGWTDGTVSQTCVDQDMVTFKILCQYKVNMDAGEGDSGSPTFQWIDQTHVAFSGIVWYATGDGGLLFAYVDQIAQDMGTWVNYGPF